ncbi:MAG: pyridoxamine 5'-phosphate oxidase family protein [Cyanobacteria bacterium J06633_2]
MAKFYDKLDDDIRSFIAEQQLFFTATAPAQGRINLSPKGIDTFRCLDEQTIAYLDLTGSGNESAAHLRENGRMTIMFCSFSDRPLILRLYGQGEVINSQHPEWETLLALFNDQPGQRQVIRLVLDSIQTSCGFGVPLFDFQGQRQTLIEWADKKGHNGLNQYRYKKNRTSIDGLPTGIIIHDVEQLATQANQE